MAKRYIDGSEVAAYNDRDHVEIEGKIAEVIEGYVNTAPAGTTEACAKAIAAGTFAINTGIATLETITGDKAFGKALEDACQRVIAAKLRRDARTDAGFGYTGGELTANTLEQMVDNLIFGRGGAFQKRIG